MISVSQTNWSLQIHLSCFWQFERKSNIFIQPWVEPRFVGRPTYSLVTKVKVKVTLWHSCAGTWGGEVRLKPFPYLGAKNRWVDSTTPESLYPREIFTTLLTGTWMGLGDRLDGHGKSRPPPPTGILSLDRRAESLRGLGYFPITFP